MILLGTLTLSTATVAQQNVHQAQLKAAVTELDNAGDVAGYRKLEGYFVRLAEADATNWLPWYYAALCNANIAFLYQQEGERILPFSERGEQQIKTALSLLDTTKQRSALSEVYVVMNRIYQSRVYVNPMTYGPKYGPVAQQYQQHAKRLNPDNPRVVYLEAWMKYYAPRMYGGDKVRAKELARQALKMLEGSAEDGTKPHWGKKECMALLNK